MLPALALSFAVGAAIEARREAILSFDGAAAGRAFPGAAVEGLSSADGAAWSAWARPVVAGALARYPLAGLLPRLDRAFVVSNLAVGGTPVGGLNDPEAGRIVVTHGPANRALLARSVHHEIAHILLDRRILWFPVVAWRAANAPGFRYGAGGLDALRRGRGSVAYDEAWAARGLLSRYAASSIDEDWATIAESVMVDDPAFWALTERFPRLREKARLAVAFYRKAFPGIRLRDVAP